MKIHRRSVIRMYMGYTVKNPDGTRVRKRPVLAAVRVGGVVRIRKTDLDSYLAKRTSVVG